MSSKRVPLSNGATSKGKFTTDASMGGSYGDDEPRPVMGYRYVLPTWVMMILAILLLCGILGVVVWHYRHDVDAYVCNGDDTDRYQCHSYCYPWSGECEEIPYYPEADGFDFNVCFFNLCVYFKEWGPMPPYPCFGGELFPIAGIEHCKDMISDDYHKKDRMLATLFCYDGTAVCVFHDKCGEYTFDGIEEASASSTSSSGSHPLHAQGLKELKDNLGDENFYIWGIAEGRKKQSSS